MYIVYFIFFSSLLSNRATRYILVYRKNYIKKDPIQIDFKWSSQWLKAQICYKNLCSFCSIHDFEEYPNKGTICSDAVRLAPTHHNLADDWGYEECKQSRNSQAIKRGFEGLIAPMQFKCATQVCQELINKV